MFGLGPATRIYLAAGATDLRKGFAGLSDLVEHRFKEDPLSGHLFAFANRTRTRIKLFYWDGTGTWICTKKLAKGSFHWPRTGPEETGALRVLAEELTLLLSGIDLERSQTRAWWRKAA